MKVLFVIDTLEVGGTEKSLLELTSRFSADIKPVVVHLFAGEALRVRFEKHNIDVISLNVHSPFAFYNCYRSLRRVISDHAPDIVVAQLFWSEFYSRLVLAGATTPLVGTFVNDSYSRSRYAKLPVVTAFKLRGYQLADMITARRCNAFLSNSMSIAESNSAALSVPLSKVKVIHRGRDLRNFEREPDYDRETRRFLAVGRLIDRKGHDDLIRAFSMLSEKYPDARLAIAGDGPQRSVLENLIADMRLDGKVTLLGTVSDVPELMRGFDCFILPSHYEGFSGALVEAMLTGLPVIASDIRMTREAIDHGSDGWLYPVGETGALASAMEFFIQNRQLAKKIAITGRAKARDRFDIEKIAKETEDFLLSLVN